jgi:hypothetical protein
MSASLRTTYQIYAQLPTQELSSDAGNLGTKVASDLPSSSSQTLLSAAAPAHLQPLPFLQHWVVLLLLLQWGMAAVIGGLSAQAPLFYQVDITSVIPNTIQVSYVLTPYVIHAPAFHTDSHCYSHR